MNPFLKENFPDTTRAVIFGIHPVLTDFLRYTFDFLGKNISFISHNENHIIESDFIIFSTDEIEAATQFSPTVLFVGNYYTEAEYGHLLNSITSGGAIIYSEQNDNISASLKQSDNFFRKISYPSPKFRIQPTYTLLESDFGNISIQINDEAALRDLLGAQQFCQQFGIMEDEFYESLVSFQ